MATGPGWPADPFAIAEHVIRAGIRSLIVLDLSAVGMGKGVITGDLCRAIRERYPRVELITGGGVRSIEDIRSAIQAGADQVLVASALHDGRLDSSDRMLRNAHKP
jgi:phosphoribosylformimino-5-aminoimidazole carboxamide ribotide isomerase